MAMAGQGTPPGSGRAMLGAAVLAAMLLGAWALAMAVRSSAAM